MITKNYKFDKNAIFSIDKEKSDSEEIICYCANITVGEIKEAVKNGNTTIKSVRSFLNKHESGNCKELSPKKICCHALFNEVIKLCMTTF